MMLRIEFLKWTKNYAVFKYTKPKIGVVYIPRSQLRAEVDCSSHLIFHTIKAKDSTT